MEKGEIAQMSNFTLFQNVFYGICILKSFNSHISVVVCSFFEFGTVSKRYGLRHNKHVALSRLKAFEDNIINVIEKLRFDY